VFVPGTVQASYIDTYAPQSKKIGVTSAGSVSHMCKPLTANTELAVELVCNKTANVAVDDTMILRYLLDYPCCKEKACRVLDIRFPRTSSGKNEWMVKNQF
jgi:hypothetical protein